MAYSRVSYVASAGQTNFGVTFPYLMQAHVSVTRNSIIVPFTWFNAATITLTTPASLNDTVVVLRSSNRAARLNDYTDGSVLTEQVMDTDGNQTLYISQEALDISDALSVRVDGLALGGIAPLAANISSVPAGSLAAANVQAALNELDGDVTAHLADTVDAHDASAISYAGGTGMAATDVEAALDELATEKANAITLVAEVGSGGTAIDFNNIPAGVKRITIMFAAVSLSSVANFLVRLGDAGGLESSGYFSASAAAVAAASSASSTGFVILSTSAANTYSGAMVLSLESSSTFTWVSTSNLAASSTSDVMVGAGRKSLSAELDRVSITTTTGTDTFDAGSISISYE